jgi:digeranylgeranylglycerophospholipid reductase
MNEYDVLVIGAGTSGSIAARFAASAGLKVCLIDAQKGKNIGNKICGDVVLSTIFDFLKINHPKGEEIMSTKSNIKLYTSDFQDYLSIDMPIYLVDRLSFGQKLLNDALDSGDIQLLDNTKVMDLTYINGTVNGVVVNTNIEGKKVLRAKIVIDGSGAHSIIRKKIKSDIIENKVSEDDLSICYRDNIEFNDSRRPDLPNNSLTVVFDADHVPGGYFWYFPKSETVSNLGLGVFFNRRREVKHIYQKFVLNKFLPARNYKILSSGGDIVPLRRPLPSCADNGIMFIGDAACHVNNASGGGIHSGMKAGYYAAKIAKNAIDAEDYTLNQLWKYNSLILDDFGTGHAANDVARILMQNTTTEDFNFIVRKKLLDDEALTNMYYSKIYSPSLKEKTEKLLKGISKPHLLLKLNYLLKQMKKVVRLYSKFPNNLRDFYNWRKAENNMFNEIYLRARP